MIRRYQQNTADVLNGLGNAAQTLVNRGNRLERGFHYAGMADHVTVGKVADDDVKTFVLNGVD